MERRVNALRCHYQSKQHYNIVALIVSRRLLSKIINTVHKLFSSHERSIGNRSRSCILLPSPSALLIISSPSLVPPFYSIRCWLSLCLSVFYLFFFLNDAIAWQIRIAKTDTTVCMLLFWPSPGHLGQSRYKVQVVSH
jgi:hypothetical protein